MNIIPLAAMDAMSVVALLVAIGAIVMLQKVLGRISDLESRIKALSAQQPKVETVASTASSQTELSSTTVVQPKLDPETVAILTAAVAAYLKAPAKKLAIRFPVVSNLNWVQEGRGDIMLSHRVR